MKEDIVDKILHSTGYLYPRNEEEMIAFEKIYSKIEIDENFHVDVESIVNSGCQYEPIGEFADNMIAAEDLRMAARNYERIPKDVIEKIKKQHNNNDD